MHSYIDALEKEFKAKADLQIAMQQKAYLQNQFECYGLKTDIRRDVQKPFLAKEFLPPKKEVSEIVMNLWKRQKREYHYFGQELIYKYIKQLEQKDIALFEYMITHNSWWDTVDFIANKLVGTYFKSYPEHRDVYVQKWLQSKNIWLQRSALLFQLKYKEHLDEVLLANSINALLGSKEFFINKAIGWVLREHSKTNPKWVLAFVAKTPLDALSKKEALRLIK